MLIEENPQISSDAGTYGRREPSKSNLGSASLPDLNSLP